MTVDDVATVKKNLNSAFEGAKSPGKGGVKKDLELKPVKEDPKSEEMDEPILTENKHRFVLFPIKYHEVRSPAFLFLVL